MSNNVGEKAIAGAFNSYFLSIAKTVTKNNVHNKVGTNNDITSPPIYFSSRISKNSFIVLGF